MSDLCRLILLCAGDSFCPAAAAAHVRGFCLSACRPEGGISGLGVWSRAFTLQRRPHRHRAAEMLAIKYNNRPLSAHRRSLQVNEAGGGRSFSQEGGFNSRAPHILTYIRRIWMPSFPRRRLRSRREKRPKREESTDGGCRRSSGSRSGNVLTR